LVGTTSVEKSGAIARILGKKGIAHHVLNAKHHENEAFIVAQAGRKGAITVSTNMAGRGTDILLGGNPEMLARLEIKQKGVTAADDSPEFKELVERHERECKIEHDEVIELGGLHIIGTERHESRRIDNQLRGRAGRQGDPGYSKFYLSLEDDLMRIFAGDRVKSLMDRMGMPDDEPIEHPLVTRSIENAQRKVEERNFDVRKNLLEYDDVMNAQRKTVYSLRQQLLAGRYVPEELDEAGKATGEGREIAVDPEILDKVSGPIGALVGMFCDPPVGITKEDGQTKYPTRETLAKVEKLVELEALQHEVYQLWGVRLDVEERRQRTPASVYDELIEMVPRGLSEQRERVLDLTDRVVAAMVEESCAEGKPPEDWDFKGLHEGFQEHFQAKLSEGVEELGEQDSVMKRAYERAEEVYREKEKELGVEIALRLFRHIYVEGIDEAWVDHLSNMEHLRDGIGLRGYGQRDPKNEYKKEGFDLFLNMMAKVSSNVLVKFFEARVQRTDEVAAREQEAERRYQEELAQVVAQHPSAETEDPAAALNQLREQAAAVPQPTR
ncbi:MAG TPA: preprotein translocase subunit SecA, partial [Polyangiaceae bacterium]|nr:preprotein translocase subunit SecA [Polyangiaceae bacterium]